MQGWFIVIIAIAYVTLLFAIASLGDRRRRDTGAGRAAALSSTALSLAIYCTSWTFFGSVGLASERGLEFLAIYIGPVLVFMFGFPLLRRIVRLAKAEKITSIADFLGARYGKSFAVALDRHADRHRRRRALYRPAAQGDFRLGQPDGRALQRRAAILRSVSSATSR